MIARLSILVALFVVGCGGDAVSPADRVPKRGEYSHFFKYPAYPGAFAAGATTGFFRLTHATPDSIAGEWNVAGYQPAPIGGAWNGAAYAIGALPVPQSASMTVKTFRVVRDSTGLRCLEGKVTLAASGSTASVIGEDCVFRFSSGLGFDLGR